MLTSWLAPPGASRSGSPTLHLWPVGSLWDALRTPAEVGMPVLDQLLADPDDAALLGPVLWDRSSRYLYWLLARGASDCYPCTTVLLPAKAWLAAPPVEGRSNRVVWLHIPDTPRLTGPAWLAAALWNHRTDPGDTAMPEDEQAAAVTALLDSLTWTPGQCSCCPAPPDEDGDDARPPVLVADGERVGVKGVRCRSHLRLALSMNGHQTQRLARADALNAKLDAHRRRYAAESAQ